jgi:hypothetical protein
MFTSTPLGEMRVSKTGTEKDSGGQAKRASPEQSVLLFKLDDETNMYVTRPAAAGDKQFTQTAVVVRGSLGLIDSPLDLLNQDRKKVPGIVATEVTPLTDGNKADAPPADTLTVVGEVVRAEAKVGERRSEWAIRDGKADIPLLFGPDVSPPPAEGKVRVAGTIVFEAGTLAVSVTDVRAVK